MRYTSPEAEKILDTKFPVLDHGGVALLDYMGNDHAIEAAARVSFVGGETEVRTKAQTEGLIRYLVQHKHTTPLEMVVLKFWVKCPIFVARQWIRHRMSCLSGNTRLWFDGKSGLDNGGRKKHSMTIKKFHDNWHNPQVMPLKKKKPTFSDVVVPEKWYTVKELAKLTQRKDVTIRQLVNTGVIPSKKEAGVYKILGQAYIDWANTSNHTEIKKSSKLKKMFLRSYDEDKKEITSTHVTDIWESGVKPVFRVVFENGYSIEMTDNHLCLTEQGWLTLKDAIGLELTANKQATWRIEHPGFACNGVPSYQSKEWLSLHREQGRSVTEIAEAGGVSYHTIRKWLKIHSLGFSSKEKSRLSGLTQRGRTRNTKPRVWTPEAKQKLREARSGENSNFWKGGITSERNKIGQWTRSVAREVHSKYNWKCAICESNRKLHAHHIDPVWNNIERAYDVDNLMSLCDRCHVTVHAKYLEMDLLETFKNKPEKINGFLSTSERKPRPKEITPASTKLSITWSKVKSVDYLGEQMTYDLSVSSPFHNFIADGLVVHNCTNEISARYSTLPNEFYLPSLDRMNKQSVSNKQGSSSDIIPEAAECLEDMETFQDRARQDYERYLNADLAKELARINLPVSQYTEFIWKIDLHNLMHFLALRLDEHAQYEIRKYAEVMADMVQKVAPIAFKAFEDYRLNAATVSSPVLDFLASCPDVIEGLRGHGVSERELKELAKKIGVPYAPAQK